MLYFRQTIDFVLNLDLDFSFDVTITSAFFSGFALDLVLLSLAFALVAALALDFGFTFLSRLVVDFSLGATLGLIVAFDFAYLDTRCLSFCLLRFDEIALLPTSRLTATFRFSLRFEAADKEVDGEVTVFLLLLLALLLALLFLLALNSWISSLSSSIFNFNDLFSDCNAFFSSLNCCTVCSNLFSFSFKLASYVDTFESFNAISCFNLLMLCSHSNSDCLLLLFSCF
mmetsp:Transcript_40165/g.64349  ORF Transcript_40165/g.64349 Transcript_40165/m.64349 type:complete len:228 (-) Transcript_40165:1651-2334(-)